MPKISELSAGTSLSGSEQIPAVQSGATDYITAEQIRNYILVSVDAFGALGDGIELYDGAITSSDATFTSTTANFASDDVGKIIEINGAGSGGAVHITTIASVTNSTTVELTDNALTTVSGDATYFYYTQDDTSAIASALAAVVANGGGRIFFTPGKKYAYQGMIFSDNTAALKYLELSTLEGDPAELRYIAKPGSNQTSGLIQIGNYSSGAGLQYVRIKNLILNGNKVNQYRGSATADGVNSGIVIHPEVTDIWIENVTAKSFDGYCIGAVGTGLPTRERLTIINCDLYDPDYDCLDIKGGFKNIVLMFNKAHDSTGGNIAGRDYPGMDLRGQSVYAVHNEIWNTQLGMRTRSWADGHIYLGHNIIHDISVGNGIQIEHPDNCNALLDNCFVYDCVNTAYKISNGYTKLRDCEAARAQYAIGIASTAQSRIYIEGGRYRQTVLDCINLDNNSGAVFIDGVDFAYAGRNAVDTDSCQLHITKSSLRNFGQINAAKRGIVMNNQDEKFSITNCFIGDDQAAKSYTADTLTFIAATGSEPAKIVDSDQLFVDNTAFEEGMTLDITGSASNNVRIRIAKINWDTIELESDANSPAGVSHDLTAEAEGATVTLTGVATSANALRLDGTPTSGGKGVFADNTISNLTSTFWSGSTRSSYIKFRNNGTAVADTAYIKLDLKEDFGAVGNGSTNDTAAIQAAIDSIADEITVPYTSSFYYVDSTLTFGSAADGYKKFIGIGNGEYSQIRWGASTNGDVFSLASSVKKVIFDRIQIHGNIAARSTGNCVTIAGASDVEFKRCLLEDGLIALVANTSASKINIEKSVIRDTTGSYAVLFNTVTKSKIVDTEITSIAGNAIRLENSSNNEILNNYTTTASDDFIYLDYASHSNKVANNNASNASTGNGIACAGYQNEIIANVCMANGKAGIGVFGSRNIVANNVLGNNATTSTNYAGIDVIAQFGGAANNNILSANNIFNTTGSQNRGIRLEGLQYTAWATSTSVSAGSYRYHLGNLYYTVAGGTTGATAPTHTSGTVSDGAVSWLYIDSSPVKFEAGYNTLVGNHVSGITTEIYDNTSTTDGSNNYVAQADYSLITAKVDTTWATSQAITYGTVRIYTDPATGITNCYRAVSSGTTGATAPTHTDGTVSDGGVSWEYISMGRYYPVISVGSTGFSIYAGAATLNCQDNVTLSCSVIAGTQDPASKVVATPGSIYLRRTGAVYYKGGSSTDANDWTEITAGSFPELNEITNVDASGTYSDGVAYSLQYNSSGSNFTLVANSAASQPNYFPYLYALQEYNYTELYNTNFDVCVIDIDDSAITPAQVATLKRQGKRVLCYFALGEVQDIRTTANGSAIPYWSNLDLGGTGSGLILPPNPDWDSNRVRYWRTEWQDEVKDMMDIILQYGFDGVYYDIVDAYGINAFGDDDDDTIINLSDPSSDTWLGYYREDNGASDTRQDMKQAMVDFIIDLSNHVKYTSTYAREEFWIVPQNGQGMAVVDEWFGDIEDIDNLNPAFINAIDAIGVENLFGYNDDFPADTSTPQSTSNDTYPSPYIDTNLPLVKHITDRNKPALCVEYVATGSYQDAVVTDAIAEGYIVYIGQRYLSSYYFSKNDAIGAETPIEIIDKVKPREANQLNPQRSMYYKTRDLMINASNQVDWNVDRVPVAKIRLTGNVTVNNPTQLKDGAEYTLLFEQDATGGRTVSWGGDYIFPYGVSPYIDPTASAVTAIKFRSDGVDLYAIQEPQNQARSGLHSIKLQVLTAAPASPAQGLLAYADGSTWNPGSGQGLYRYNGSSWTFVG